MRCKEQKEVWASAEVPCHAGHAGHALAVNVLKALVKQLGEFQLRSKVQLRGSKGAEGKVKKTKRT